MRKAISLPYFFSRILLLIGTGLVVYASMGCKSNPRIIEYQVADGIRQYYFPYTVWKTKETNNIIVRLDITHRTETGRDVVCNISFIKKNAIVQRVSDIELYADELGYRLENVTLFLLDHAINAFRITSTLSVEQFLTVAASRSIILKAKIDDEAYYFNPPKDFFLYLSQYREHLSIY
jgi:hypothetical protein